MPPLPSTSMPIKNKFGYNVKTKPTKINYECLVESVSVENMKYQIDNFNDISKNYDWLLKNKFI